MKLFRHSQGFIIAFGFDMVRRVPAPRMICWCDPVTGAWEATSANSAGDMRMSFTVDPEFIREHAGRVIAYQPGKCIEMDLIGLPFVWSVRTLQSDEQSLAEVA